MPDLLDRATSAGIHLNFDDAWDAGVLGLTTVDLRECGRQLRFAAPRALIENFYRDIEPRLSRFTLYGSGDFHHLTALWLRRVRERVVVVCFDNHPDWDVRPPRWACGAWVNRALELPHVEQVVIWGCGNFECWWPGQLFGNRRAERAGRIELHVWGDDRPPDKRERRGVMFRGNWREEFEAFVRRIAGRNIYITVDLDCLTTAEAVTNWENGKFSADEVASSIARLREMTKIVGGDVCGAYSLAQCARRGQRFIADWDHPKFSAVDVDDARRINVAALEKIWPALTD